MISSMSAGLRAGTLLIKETMSKKPIKISVTTHPNGYSLTVKGNEYFCYSTEQLLAEVFLRVGVHELDYLNADLVKMILQAALTWGTLGEALEANAVLMAKAHRAQLDCVAAERARVKACEAEDQAIEKYEQMRRENVALGLENDKLKRDLMKIGVTPVGGSPRKKPKSRPLTVVSDEDDKSLETKKKKADKRLNHADTLPTAVVVPDPTKPEHYNPKVKYTQEQWELLTSPIKAMKLTGRLGSRAMAVMAQIGHQMDLGTNKTIGEALRNDERTAIYTRGSGPATVNTINQWLKEHGLTWKMDVDSILYHHKENLKNGKAG